MIYTDYKIALIGLGYVGLPLAVAFGKKFNVIGFDINETRVHELKQGNDITLETNSEEIKLATNLTFTTDLNEIKKCNVYIVTVPTPINQFKSPDLTPLLSATKMLGKIIKKGDIVIYESTVYPGCTEEECVPVLEKESNLKFNVDFYCGYSPERINPGDKVNTLTKIIKVTSGSNENVANIIDNLYKSIIVAGTYKAQSIKVAEASKAIENAQRDVNISFVNVLDAAGTKWNFLKYKPGLVGGHCIGVDPYYLAHKAESLGYYPQVILSGRRVNDNMGIFVANKVVKLLIQKGNLIRGARALILGVTFKENCPDIRNSKVVDIYNELLQFGLNVDVYDPYANLEEVYKEYNIKLINEIEKYDAIILAVGHDYFLKIDYNSLKKENSSVIFDIKSILPNRPKDSNTDFATFN